MRQALAGSVTLMEMERLISCRLWPNPDKGAPDWSTREGTGERPPRIFPQQQQQRAPRREGGKKIGEGSELQTFSHVRFSSGFQSEPNLNMHLLSFSLKSKIANLFNGEIGKI